MWQACIPRQPFIPNTLESCGKVLSWERDNLFETDILSVSWKQIAITAQGFWKHLTAVYEREMATKTCGEREFDLEQAGKLKGAGEGKAHGPTLVSEKNSISWRQFQKQRTKPSLPTSLGYPSFLQSTYSQADFEIHKDFVDHFPHKNTIFLS